MSDAEHDILLKMEKVRWICAIGHRQRVKAKIPVRYPLSKITIPKDFFEDDFPFEEHKKRKQ